MDTDTESTMDTDTTAPHEPTPLSRPTPPPTSRPRPTRAGDGRSADVVIVGGRVAGAATARLLARLGWDVLVLDRTPYGSDTLSTHALMRGAVVQLDRWGLLDRVIAAGTPAIDCVRFDYAGRRFPIHLDEPLYAPRRTVLDAILADAAEEAGARVRRGVHVTDLLRDRAGRVVGVRTRDHDGVDEIRARVVVGADGRTSSVARAVEAPVTLRGRGRGATIYGHVRGMEARDIEWLYAPGVAAGIIPTNDDEACVFIGASRDRFLGELRHDLDDGFHRVLGEASPDALARVTAAELHRPLRGYPGLSGWLRRPWGPGWALVGDAGSFKDPWAAHGLTDALRDAELLALALDGALADPRDERAHLAGYERARDELSLPIFAAAEGLGSFSWTLDELAQHHLALSEAMQREVAAIEAFEPAPTAAESPAA